MNFPGLDSLQVLLVDHDRARLARSCGWLLAKGHDVTTRSTAAGLADTVSDLRPNVVLIDVLVPELAASEWRSFLHQCRATGDPAIIVHTQILPKILRAVVDCHFVLGVLRPTDDEKEFSARFETLVCLARSKRPRRPASGTHRIELAGAAETSGTRRGTG
jgi:hypothetical protein